MQGFSIPTINTIGLCVLAWPSCPKLWTVDLEVQAIQVWTPSEIFCFYFYSSLMNKIICIRRESHWIKCLLFFGNINRKIYLGRKLRPISIKPEVPAIVYYINCLVFKVFKKLYLLKWISRMVISIKLLKRLKQRLNNIPKNIILFVWIIPDE